MKIGTRDHSVVGVGVFLFKMPGLVILLLMFVIATVTTSERLEAWDVETASEGLPMNSASDDGGNAGGLKLGGLRLKSRNNAGFDGVDKAVHEGGARIAYTVEGTWVLIEESRVSGRCPSTIVHGAFSRPGGRTVGIRHDRIIQDGFECGRGGGNGNEEADQNILVYYRSGRYTRRLEPREEVSELPTPLKETLSDYKFARATLFAMFRSQSAFLFGYEQRDRICGSDEKLFKERTTSFVITPKVKEVSVYGLSTSLSVGARWMVMIPRLLNLSCVYAANETVGMEEANDDEKSTVVPSADGVGDGDGDAECFPGSATVRLWDGRVLAMSELRAGDRVMVGESGRMGVVYGFSHRSSDAIVKFVQVGLECGRIVRVSRGHLVYSDKGIKKAVNIEKGDGLFIETGRISLVMNVSIVLDRGLYNPQTDIGDVMVNGIRMTTYTSAIGSQTAHAALIPFRAMFQACGFSGVDMITETLRKVSFIRRLISERHSVWTVAWGLRHGRTYS